MAESISLKHKPLALALTCIFLSAWELGKAQYTNIPPQTAAAEFLGNQYLPGIEGLHDYHPETVSTSTNPDHVVVEALSCFDEEQIYVGCIEAYRLTKSGDLHVPPGNVEAYCNSPCVSETYLILDCLEGILSVFKFYNKATINDVRETIKDGCSKGPRRGDFDVTKHVQRRTSNAHKISSQFHHGLPLLMIIMGRHFFP